MISHSLGSCLNRGRKPRTHWIKPVQISMFYSFLCGKIISQINLTLYFFYHPDNCQNHDHEAWLALPHIISPPCHLAVMPFPISPASTQWWHFEVVLMRFLNLWFLLKIDNLLWYKPQASIFNETFRWISKNYLAMPNILIRLYSQFNPLNLLWWSQYLVFSLRCMR